jgi:hypothetical protein
MIFTHNFFFKSSHWLLEKKVPKKKWKKIGNRMRFSAIVFEYLRIEKKILLVAFIWQCFSRNLTQIDLNRIINYYKRKFRKNWGKKLNVECDIDENFKYDQRFFLLLCSFSSWGPNFWIKMFFSINTTLIYNDLLYKCP